MNEAEAMAIELLDLGDAMIETRQWSVWPLWPDSVYAWGQKEG